MNHQEKLLPNHELQEESIDYFGQMWKAFRCPKMQLNTISELKEMFPPTLDFGGKVLSDTHLNSRILDYKFHFAISFLQSGVFNSSEFSLPNPIVSYFFTKMITHMEGRIWQFPPPNSQFFIGSNIWKIVVVYCAFIQPRSLRQGT